MWPSSIGRFLVRRNPVTSEPDSGLNRVKKKKLHILIPSTIPTDVGKVKLLLMLSGIKYPTRGKLSRRKLNGRSEDVRHVGMIYKLSIRNLKCLPYSA